MIEKFTETFKEEDIRQVLTRAHAVKEKVTDESWLNHQLFQVLCLNLEGKALAMVKNLQDESKKDINGVLGWFKLVQDCSSMTSQRLQGLAGKVYSPKRCKLYGDVNGAIEDWEANISIFTKAEGTEKLKENSKMFIIKQIFPKSLKRT